MGSGILLVPNRRNRTLPDLRKPHERLALSEFYAAKFVATGVSRKQACSKMGIHRTTMIRTINRALRKMELTSEKDLVTYQSKHGVF